MIKEIDESKLLLDDFTYFVNFVHRKIYNTDFIWEIAQKKIVSALTRAYSLELEFLGIYVPPRIGKTTLLSYWIAWTMTKDERVYNNYYSGSDTLVKKAYSLIKKVIELPKIAELHAYTFKKEDADYRNAVGGGLFAMTINGQTIGNGAGTKTNIHKFNGAIVIDDPHKMNDSFVKLLNIVEATKDGVLSRKNNYRVPVILIMQRVSILDLANYLNNFYTKEILKKKGEILKIPVWDGITSISTSTYPVAVIEREIEKDNNFYWTQLMQDPKVLMGVYFKDKNFSLVEKITADTSSMIVFLNEENTVEPVVLLAFSVNENGFVIVDYLESTLDPSDFFISVKDFYFNNNCSKIIMTKNLITKVVEKEFDYLQLEAVDNIKNVKLETFYSVGLLKNKKIELLDSDRSLALIEELKDYPNSKRDFTVKAVIKAIEWSMTNVNNSISKSL